MFLKSPELTVVSPITHEDYTKAKMNETRFILWQFGAF
jgi:hypothetical protein